MNSRQQPAKPETQNARQFPGKSKVATRERDNLIPFLLVNDPLVKSPIPPSVGGYGNARLRGSACLRLQRGHPITKTVLHFY